MKFRWTRLALLILLAASAACSSTSGSSSTTSGSPSVAAPLAISPAAAASVPNLSQPVTLIVRNAVATGAGNVYTFEVSTDAAFGSKIYTKSGVAEDPGGQTGIVIDKLPAGADYFWRARADSGGTTGPYSANRKLTIGPEKVIDPPRPVTPLSGLATNGWQPFTVNNSSRFGPVGAISYKFEVSTNSTFTNVIVSGTVSETGGVNGQTSFSPPATQGTPSTTSLFWRATASDTTGVSSAPSDVVSFTWGSPRSVAGDKATQEGQVLWPGAVPPGTPGHVVFGSFWNVEPLIAFGGASFVSPPMETLRVIDCIDRGMSPQAAIDWVGSHGYDTGGTLFYPSLLVVGFHYEYMGIRQGTTNIWDLVLRGE